MKKVLSVLLTAFFSVNAIAQCNSGSPYPIPIAWWDFTNGSTTDLINGWTPSAGGTSGATTGYAGNPNTAVSFNGSSDYLKFAYDPLMDLTSFTIMAIVKPTGFYSGNCEGNGIVYRGMMYSSHYYGLDISDNSWDANNGYKSPTYCGVYSPGHEYFEFGPAGIAGFPNTDWCCTNGSTAPVVSTGIWYCVAATYDASTGDVNLYVNGNLVVSNPGGWSNQFNWTGHPDDLFIGSGSDLVNYPYWFNGAIDDIKIFDAALSASDVSAYSCIDVASATISCPGTICEGQSTTLSFQGTSGSTVTYDDGSGPQYVNLPTSGVTISPTTTTTYTITQVAGPGSTPGIALSPCSCTVNVIPQYTITSIVSNSSVNAITITGTPGALVSLNIRDINGNLIGGTQCALDMNGQLVLPSTTPPYCSLPSGTFLIDVISVSDPGNTCIWPASGRAQFVTPLPRYASNIAATTSFSNARIYPNPNTGRFNLRADIPAGLTVKDANIEIVDLHGKLVYSKNIRLDNAKLDLEILINESHAAGLYVIKISNAEINQVIPFTLER